MKAQFNVTKLGTTTQIVNNDILVFNTVGDEAAKLKFKINNTTATAIRIKIRCVSITNATGSGMEFCFSGSCISDVAANTNYPTDTPFYSEIPAMGSNGNFDHFKNGNVGNGISVQDYVFKFFQVDNFGDQIGNAITMTYRYTPALGTTGFSLSNLGIQLKSNVVDNHLEINSDNTGVTMEIFDLTGKKVQTERLSIINIIDVSQLNKSIYLVNFIDSKGQSASTKFIKR
jgi:hypothetical protein